MGGGHMGQMLRQAKGSTNPGVVRTPGCKRCSRQSAPPTCHNHCAVPFAHRPGTLRPPCPPCLPHLGTHGPDVLHRAGRVLAAVLNGCRGTGCRVHRAGVLTNSAGGAAASAALLASVPCWLLGTPISTHVPTRDGSTAGADGRKACSQRVGIKAPNQQGAGLIIPPFQAKQAFSTKTMPIGLTGRGELHQGVAGHGGVHLADGHCGQGSGGALARVGRQGLVHGSAGMPSSWDGRGEGRGRERQGEGAHLGSSSSRSAGRR